MHGLPGVENDRSGTGCVQNEPGGDEGEAGCRSGVRSEVTGMSVLAFGNEEQGMGRTRVVPSGIEGEGNVLSVYVGL